MPQQQLLLDTRQIDALVRDFQRWSNDTFSKREAVSVGAAGTNPIVTAARRIAKRRPAGAGIHVFQTANRGPRYATIPGNLAKSIRRTPQRLIRRSRFAYVGAAFKDVNQAGSYFVRAGEYGQGNAVPLHGRTTRDAYASYAYKAYGDDSGGSYDNWYRKLVIPAVTIGSSGALQRMETRTLQIIDRKLKKYIV